jgi:hypothetical protein
MARVDPISPAQAGWSIRLTYWFTRRALSRCPAAAWKR